MTNKQADTFTLLDKDPASLRLIMMLQVRGGRTPKMTLRGIARHHGINPAQFDRTMGLLRELGLAIDIEVSIPGRRGKEKHPQLTKRGIKAAETIKQLQVLVNNDKEE